ncbi:MAG: ABC transporter permease subunit [Planctomycetes bacterium]|nr:ABC transporter permease subunit [Planctomycetota bacterium]
MFKNAFNNPELERNILYRLRPKMAVLTLVFTVAFCVFVALVTLLNNNRYYYGYYNDGGLELFRFYTGFALILGYSYALLAASFSIISEKTRKTYDLLFMAPMSDAQISIGKLIGSSIHMWLILGIVTPFITFAAVRSYETIGLYNFTLFYLVLISGCVLCASIGLLFSVSINPKSSLIVAAGNIIIMGSALGGLIAGFARTDNQFLAILTPTSFLARFDSYDHALTSADFFGLSIDKGLLTIAIYIWFSFWIIRAVIRRIRNPYGTYLKPLEALGFFAGLEIFLTGMHWNTFTQPSHIWNAFSFYLLFNGLVLVMMVLLMALPRDTYQDYVRGILAKRPFGFMDRKSPPHILLLLLCGVLFAGLYGIINSNDISVKYAPEIYLAFWVLVAFVYIFYLLVQFCKTIFVYSGPLVAVLIICAASIIPSIILGVCRMPEKYFLYFNPIAYIMEIPGVYRHDYWHLRDADYFGPPVALTILLGVMLVVFVMRHYQLRAKIARRMKE